MYCRETPENDTDYVDSPYNLYLVRLHMDCSMKGRGGEHGISE
jgi:hypothetical protein